MSRLREIDISATDADNCMWKPSQAWPRNDSIILPWPCKTLTDASREYEKTTLIYFNIPTRRGKKVHYTVSSCYKLSHLPETPNKSHNIGRSFFCLKQFYYPNLDRSEWIHATERRSVYVCTRVRGKLFQNEEASSIFNILSPPLKNGKRILCEGLGVQAERKQVPIRGERQKGAMECRKKLSFWQGLMGNTSVCLFSCLETCFRQCARHHCLTYGIWMLGLAVMA